MPPAAATVDPSPVDPSPVDIVVVGAGIVGLAHALGAAERGLRVHVVERDHRAVGASVRNFGHIGVAAQAGDALDHAWAGRSTWLRTGAAAGFDVAESGAVVVARADDEMAVLEEFAAGRAGEVEVLDATGVARLVPVGDEVIGGAHLGPDLRVDQRRAVAALAAWLESRGVTFSWGATFLGVAPGTAHTSRGSIPTGATVVCVGHDVDRVFPAVAAEAGVRRCRLHMLEVDGPAGVAIAPAVLSGLSLLRYAGFADCPTLASMRARLAAERPELIDAGVNLMFTQRLDGSLVVGDTHHQALTPDPFPAETLDELLLAESAALLGVDRLRVRSRWRGTYAAAGGEFLVAPRGPSVRIVSVTSGIGMTTAFGLAASVLDGLGA